MPEIKYGKKYRYSELARTMRGTPTKWYGIPDQEKLEKETKGDGKQYKLPSGKWIKIRLRYDSDNDDLDQYVVTEVK